MVKQIIRRLAEQMPEHGLAFHGTLWKHIPSIKKEGLRSANYPGARVYVTVIPAKKFMDNDVQRSEREIFERSVGSALFASVYSALKIEGKIDKGNLPALVVLKGSRWYSFHTGLEDRDLRFHPNDKEWRSFGRVTFDQIPKENIAAVVRITPREYQRILSKHSAEYADLAAAVHKLMVRKALLAVRSVIETQGKLRKNK